MNIRVNSTIGYWLLVCFWGLTSCSDYEELAASSGSVKEAQLQLSVTPLSSGDTSTRSTSGCMDVSFGASSLTRAATDAENKIANFMVTQFDERNYYVTRLVYNSVNSISSAVQTVPFVANYQGSNKVYAIANTGQGGFSTSAEFENQYCNDMADQAAMVKYGGIPMVGSTTANMNTGDALSIPLTRMVAKLNFTYKVAAGSSFTPASVTLKDVPTKVRFMPNGVSDPGANVREYALSTVAGQVSTVYIPENLRGRNEGITAQTQRSAANAPVRSTYIEIKGIFNDGTYTYDDITYRLYLGSGDMKDFNVVRNCEYTIIATIKGGDSNDKRVTFNGERYIDLSKNETANCYIVEKTNSLCFFDATKKGNNESPGQTGNVDLISPTMTPQGVKILWEMGNNPTVAPAAGSIIKNVKLSNGRVQFHTGTVSEGNALIGVYSDAACSGKPLWSWHIWITAKKPGDVLVKTSPTYNRTFIMMNRNLGAANNNANDPRAFGLLYQRGRKDPFPGANAMSGTGFYASVPIFPAPIKSSSTITPDWSDSNPTQFVYGTTNWLAKTDHNRWGNPENVGGDSKRGYKTYYDPCPPGYRVPSRASFSATYNGSASSIGSNSPLIVSGTSFTSGYVFQLVADGVSGMFFPASGWRNRTDGMLIEVGQKGHYWVSSKAVNLTVVHSFCFYLNRAELKDTQQSYGCSIRCVSTAIDVK